MKHTKMVYGNCLLGGMYLCLRGKAKKVGFVSSHAWYVPAHVVVETKRHNILHFKYAMEQNPLYFKGCFSNISWHGTDITFEYILSLANLWLVSIAKFTSEPLAKIVSLTFLLVLKTS